MGKHTFTKDEIKQIYHNIDCDIYRKIANDEITAGDVFKYRMDVLEGVYITLNALADNWEDVKRFIDLIESDPSFNRDYVD